MADGADQLRRSCPRHSGGPVLPIPTLRARGLCDSGPMTRREALPELDVDGRRELLTIMTAEHSNLQAARSAGVVESNSRTTSFFAALSGSLVTLALLAQVESLSAILVPIALVIATTVLYAGLVTFVRLAQLATLDSRLVMGINRIRHRYLELAPSLATVEVLSAHDDRAGILGEAGLTGRSGGRLDVLAAAPAMVAGIDGIVAGAIAGLIAAQIGAPTPISLAIGFGAGLATDAALLAYGFRAGTRFWQAASPRYPTPRPVGGPDGRL